MLYEHILASTRVLYYLPDLVKVNINFEIFSMLTTHHKEQIYNQI